VAGAGALVPRGRTALGGECLISVRDNGGDGAKLLTVVEGGSINDNSHKLKERLTQGKTVSCI